MKQVNAASKLTWYLSWIAAVIIVLVPFHAFLTVWLNSLAHHYTLLRLWKEFLLLPLVAGALYILAVDKPLRRKFASSRLNWLIAVYFVVLLACGFGALAAHDVTAKAMWYGLLVDSRFLVFFWALMIISARCGALKRNWQQLLFIPVVIVGAVAILQYLVLPYDFLRHFGYNQDTIYPYETINHNINHLRVMGTLRGANPLGAYLVVPLAALGVLLFKEERERRDKLMFGFGLLLALWFSYSRSAWLGAALALLAAAWLACQKAAVRKTIAWTLVGLVVLAAASSLIFRNNLAFEDAILHTDNKSTIKVSSNQGHSAAFKSAVKDIYRQPLGGGVGTAGPQSVYNNGKIRLAENYFLQVGQEAGALGMVLFIAICAAAGKQLYAKRADPLALALFASLLGLSLVNLLSHAWSDDTLAYIWWGLAGIALAPKLTTRKNN